MTSAPSPHADDGAVLLSGWPYRALVWSALLSAIGYLGFSLWAGWQDVGSSVGKVGALGIVAVLSLSLVNYGLRFIRWQAYLRAMDHPVPWWPCANMFHGGVTFPFVGFR